MADWHVTEALTSVRKLTSVMSKLTDEEIAKVIKLEEAAQRRDTILEKLYREQRQRARKQLTRSK